MPERQKPSDAEYFARLEALRNPSGHRICTRNEIDELTRMRVDLDKLTALFSLEDDSGNERFFARTVTTFITNGYDVDELLQAATLRDHTDNLILVSSVQFFDFAKSKKPLQEAIDFVNVRDSFGRTIYRNDKDEGGDFSGFESIGRAVAEGITAAQVKELVALVDTKSQSVFTTPSGIKRFLENKGTVAYARALLSCRTHEDIEIFDQYSIGLFAKSDGSVEYALKLASFRDTSNRTIFSDGYDIYRFLEMEKSAKDTHGIPVDISTVEAVVALTDNHGKTLFRGGKDIVSSLYAARGSIETIQAYTAITDENGQTSFTGKDISILLKHNVPVEYASVLAKKGLNAQTIMYYYKAGFSDDHIDFQHDGRLKAVIFYPVDDPPGYAGETVYSDDGTFDHLRIYANAYDLKIRALGSVEELGKEIDKTDDAYFLILGGHGNGTSIRYGRSDPVYERDIPEASASLTTSNTEIADSLKKLPSLEYILVDSCLAGYKEGKGDNMVNFLASCVPGVVVTGPSGLTNSRLTEVITAIPPQVYMTDKQNYQDCTYTKMVPKIQY